MASKAIAAKEAAPCQGAEQAFSYRSYHERPLNITLLSPDDLAAKYGITYHINHLRRLWLSGRFPAPVKLGEGRMGKIAFVQSEIEGWIARRINARDGRVA